MKSIFAQELESLERRLPLLRNFRRLAFERNVFGESTFHRENLKKNQCEHKGVYT